MSHNFFDLATIVISFIMYFSNVCCIFDDLLQIHDHDSLTK